MSLWVQGAARELLQVLPVALVEVTLAYGLWIIDSVPQVGVLELVDKLEKEILKLEEEQADLNTQLADPDSYNNPQKGKELNEQASRIARRLKEKNYEWEIETDKLSELQG